MRNVPIGFIILFVASAVGLAVAVLNVIATLRHRLYTRGWRQRQRRRR